VLQEYHLKFYKSSWNFNSNRARYKEFFGCSVTNRGSVWWFVFLSSWFPLFWGVIIFSFLIIYNLFSMIVSVSYYCLMILSEFHKKKEGKSWHFKNCNACSCKHYNLFFKHVQMLAPCPWKIIHDKVPSNYIRKI
jgi:hypothetical protein